MQKKECGCAVNLQPSWHHRRGHWLQDLLRATLQFGTEGSQDRAGKTHQCHWLLDPNVFVCLVTRKWQHNKCTALGVGGVHSLHPQPGWVLSSLQGRSHAVASQQVLKCMFSSLWVSCWFQNSSSHSELSALEELCWIRPQAYCYAGVLYSNGDALVKKCIQFCSSHLRFCHWPS